MSNFSTSLKNDSAISNKTTNEKDRGLKHNTESIDDKYYGSEDIIHCKFTKNAADIN